MRFFKKKAKVDNLISIADISSISLISKITDIELQKIVEIKITKSGDINYIVFAAVFKESKIKVLYVLVSDELPQADLNILAKRLPLLKKGFTYEAIRKTTISSLKDAKTSYKSESIMSESQCAIYFNQILAQAVNINTSDIHISARPNEAVVKLRVNGDLIELEHYTYDDMLKIISAAYNKLASRDSKDEHFDVKETHETAIRKSINGKFYNLRFISKPITPSGSFNVTIRVIDESFAIEIDQLGYMDNQLSKLTKASNNHNGIVVLSGEVGSGKSVTIQSLAKYYIKLATVGGNLTKKLVTFESPVEYPIAGAEQIEYKRNPKNSDEQERLHLEANIQSLLRMDSDACVLQEIRSKNTAQLAIDLVQSNNLVFTTVHAQSALQIFNRFQGLGMSIDILTEPSFLLALVYQTLIKTPCNHCATKLTTEHQELKERLISLINRYSLDESLLYNVRIINSKGCQHCHYGVSGRTIVAEIIEPTLKLLAACKNNDHQLAHKAFREDGGITYKEHALMKILMGQICPLAYENKVSSLAEDNIYDDIDQNFYAKIFQDVQWGDSDA